MKRPLISIIVPIYNSEKYLKECLQSIQEQNIDSLEVICVNDGSTDDSLKILETFSKEDPRFLIFSKENAGLPAARNTGLRFATGKYVMHLDSDDYLNPNSLSSLLDQIEKEGADILVFGGETFPYPIQWANTCLNVRNLTVEGDKVFAALFYEPGSRPFTWNKLYRLDLIRDNQCYYSENIELGEDQAYQFFIFPFAKKIVYSSKTVYKYRQHNESMMSFYGNNPEERLCGHVGLINCVFENWVKFGFIKGREQDFANWAMDHVFFDDVIKTPIGKEIKILPLLKRIVKIAGGARRLNKQNEKTYKTLVAVSKIRAFCSCFNDEIDGVAINNSKALSCLTRMARRIIK